MLHVTLLDVEVEFQLPMVWECLTEKVQRSKASEGRGETENPEERSRHTARNTKCKCLEAERCLVPELQYGAETVKREIREVMETP